MGKTLKLNNQFRGIFGIRLYIKFLTAYVPADHRQNKGNIFLVKYINVYIQQTYIITNSYLKNINVFYQISA